MLNDAVIDHWADIYQACGLRAEISFELFLSDPWRYLREFGQETAPTLIEQGWRPLLPRPGARSRGSYPASTKVARYTPAPCVCAAERIRDHVDPIDRTAR